MIVLQDRYLMDRYMMDRDMTGARLGRAVGCSRQFISQLITGRRRSATDEVAEAIEYELEVLPGTLFKRVL